MKNLETMKCNELRLMARDLGIKGYGSKGKEWLIPRITEIMEAKAAEAKAAEKKPAKVNTDSMRSATTAIAGSSRR